MVWWWQVLAVAFRGHWAALASSGAARAAYHATALRHSATRVDHTSKHQVGGWLALNNKPTPLRMHYTRSVPSLVEQSVPSSFGCHADKVEAESCGQLGCYNRSSTQLVSFIRSQPTTSQLSLTPP